MQQIALADATKSLQEYASVLNTTTNSLVFVDGEKPVVALIRLDAIDLEAFTEFGRSKIVWQESAPNWMSPLNKL